jgi:hypothetical protein
MYDWKSSRWCPTVLATLLAMAPATIITLIRRRQTRKPWLDLPVSLCPMAGHRLLLTRLTRTDTSPTLNTKDRLSIRRTTASRNPPTNQPRYTNQLTNLQQLLLSLISLNRLSGKFSALSFRFMILFLLLVSEYSWWWNWITRLYCIYWFLLNKKLVFNCSPIRLIQLIKTKQVTIYYILQNSGNTISQRNIIFQYFPTN